MNSILSYMGGKSLLANKIIPLIPKHTCYCEGFAGAAWILFKKEQSKVEIINDINTDLTTLYKVVKHHLDEFIRYFRWLLVSRDEFERFKTTPPDVLTDIQRSVRFYFLLKNGYGSRLVNPTFSVSTQRHSNFNLLRIEEELSAAHIRLARVYVENMHYLKLLERYDRPHTFFYIDPQYWKCENYYGKGIFSREDFQKLRDGLQKVKGTFIMSINDVAEIRKLFTGFHIEQVHTVYSCGKVEKKRVSELLIMNFKPSPKRP